MIINLYKNSSDIIEVNKNINEVLSLTGTIKEGTSFTTPSILIELSNIEKYYELVDSNDNEIVDDLDDIVDASLITLNDFNYAYITEFKRYYYINDIVVENNRLFRLNMSVDVLMSFKDYYLELDALVSRNEYLYDDNIEDDKMSYAYRELVSITNLDTAEFSFDTDLDITDYNYAITYYDNQGVSGNTSYVGNPLPSNVLPKITYSASGRNRFNKTGFLRTGDVDGLANYGINHASELSYVISLVCYPFKIPVNTLANQDLYLGKEKVDVGGGQSIKVVGLSDTYNLNLSDYYLIASFNLNSLVYDGYMKYEPYTKYELYLPYYGYVELKSSDILDANINVYYSFDWANGTAKINIINVNKGYIIKSLTANVGIKVAVNRDNQQQLNDEKTQLAIKSTLNTIGSVASLVVGGITHNPYLTAGGISGLTSTAVDIGQSLELMHDKASAFINSSYEGLYSTQVCKLKQTLYAKKEPTNYSKFYGKPLNQTKKLKALSGYTLVKDIHLDTLPATKNELNELMTLLTSGIIL